MHSIVGDQAQSFLQSSCKKVAVDDTGWESLYMEISSKEYWHLTYPNSEMHGGGEALLEPISPSRAKELFNV